MAYLPPGGHLSFMVALGPAPALIALALALQLPVPLRVARVERVTSAPGARDNAAAVATAHGLMLGEAISVRALLQGTAFERLAVPMAGLAGTSLFMEGRLGIVFVATSARQQDVFVAWLEPAGS